MNRSHHGLVCMGIIAAIAATVVAGCSSSNPTREETDQSLGTLGLALTGVGSSGTEYRLRYATFAVSGASDSSVSSEDYLDIKTVRLALRTGAYLIGLDDGWLLERRTSDGYETVDAILVSDNPVAFTIRAEETTQVAFRFETGNDVVSVGWGNLDVSIQVVERQSGTGGSPAAGGAGGTGGSSGTAYGGAVQGGVTLEHGTAMLVGQQPTNGNNYVTTGDVNGDGWPDIALTHGFATGAVVLNQKNEAFAPEILISESWWQIQSAIGASSVSLADLDLDGDLDYVFSIYGDHYVEKKVQLYAGDGNGNHAIPSQLPNGLIYELRGANPMGNQVADLDHNGLPDVVIGSNNGAHTVDIILQTSPWVFTPKYAYNQNGQSNPQWIEVGDLNNDGWTDLVVPFLYGTVEIYLNTANGTGAMTYAGGYLSDHHSRATVADFNGDGFADIATRSEYENHVDILNNDGTGRFSTTKSFIVSSPSSTSAGGMVRAGDIDGDGTMDLVVCSSSSSTVDVLLNDGHGSFHAAIPIVLDEPPYTMALADFDRDGDLDVAVYTTTQNVSDHLRVLWNRRK